MCVWDVESLKLLSWPFDLFNFDLQFEQGLLGSRRAHPRQGGNKLQGGRRAACSSAATARSSSARPRLAARSSTEMDSQELGIDCVDHQGTLLPNTLPRSCCGGTGRTRSGRRKRSGSWVAVASSSRSSMACMKMKISPALVNGLTELWPKGDAASISVQMEKEGRVLRNGTTNVTNLWARKRLQC